MNWVPYGLNFAFPFPLHPEHEVLEEDEEDAEAHHRRHHREHAYTAPIPCQQQQWLVTSGYSSERTSLFQFEHSYGS